MARPTILIPYGAIAVPAWFARLSPTIQALLFGFIAIHVLGIVAAVWYYVVAGPAVPFKRKFH
jgi:hypothetical protein